MAALDIQVALKPTGISFNKLREAHVRNMQKNMRMKCTWLDEKSKLSGRSRGMHPKLYVRGKCVCSQRGWSSEKVRECTLVDDIKEDSPDSERGTCHKSGECSFIKFHGAKTLDDFHYECPR